MNRNDYAEFSTQTLAWGLRELDSDRYFRGTQGFWRARGAKIVNQVERMGARQHAVLDVDDAMQMMMLAVARRRVVKDPRSFVPWVLVSSEFETIKGVRGLCGFDKKTYRTLKASHVLFEEAHHGVLSARSVEAVGERSFALKAFLAKAKSHNRLELKAIAATDGDLMEAAELLWSDTYAKGIWGSFAGVCDAIENVVETMLKGDA